MVIYSTCPIVFATFNLRLSSLSLNEVIHSWYILDITSMKINLYNAECDVSHSSQYHSVYNYSVTLLGHLRFFLDPICLRLVSAWSTTEDESHDLGQVAIFPTSENTKLTAATARRSFAWLSNSLKYLIVFQATPLYPCYVLTWLVVAIRGQRKNGGQT